GLVAAGVAHLAGVGVATDTVLGAVRAVAFAATAGVLLWLWVRAARRVRPGAAGTRLVIVHAGCALLAVVVLGPAVHPWYVTWPFAVLAAAGLAGRPRAGVVIASALLCFLVLPDGYNLARATEPVGLALDVLVAALLVTLGVRRLRRSRTPEGTPV
ncbi:MAG: hypothetical protein WCB04_08100, partial [Mycobacteriales bacterium]